MLIGAIALVLCTCAAMADTGCPQVPETQGFVTSTAMSALGTVTETDSIVNIIANQGRTNLPYPLDSPVLAEYTGSYTENTIADQGRVTYTKGMTTDTSGMASSNLYNVQTDKVVEFIGTDTGRMTSDENTVLDGAGTWFLNQEIMICPFASPSIFSANPAFCNIIQGGSSVDLTLGSLATGTGQRYIMEKGITVGEGADVPVSDPGIESYYAITLTGFGDIPAMGYADAYMNVHIQEAKLIPGFELPNFKSEDLAYSETTTASGDITLFQKVMEYNSKITSSGQTLPL
jgi:hypothetical protein